MEEFIITGVIGACILICIGVIATYKLIMKVDNKCKGMKMVAFMFSVVMGTVIALGSAYVIAECVEYVQIDGKIVEIGGSTFEVEETESGDVVQMCIKTEEGNYYRLNINMKEFKFAIKCGSDEKYSEVKSLAGRVYVGDERLREKVRAGDEISVKVSRICVRKISKEQVNTVKEECKESEWEREMEVLK